MRPSFILLCLSVLAVCQIANAIYVPFLNWGDSSWNNSQLPLPVIRNGETLESVAATSPEPSTATPACAANNVCFVLDQSGSVAMDYTVLQAFVQQIARDVAHRSPGTKFSAYGFPGMSESPAVIQTATADLEAFIASVGAETIPEGASVIFSAFNACFNELRGSAEDSVIVVISDGNDVGRTRAISISDNVKQTGIVIAGIGIGPFITGFLRRMSSPRNAVKTRYTKTNFGTLSSAIPIVTRDICLKQESIPPTKPPTTTAPTTTTMKRTPEPEPTIGPCAVDSICFAIDRSGSVQSNYREEAAFAVYVATEVQMRNTDAVFSAVTYSDTSTVIQTSTNNLAKFSRSVRRGLSPAGQTDIILGVNDCVKELSLTSTESKVLVIFTDGIDTGSPRAISIAEDLRNNGITAVTVGIGRAVNKIYLERLAFTPDRFFPTEFGKLMESAPILTRTICTEPGAAIVTPPPITTPPRTTLPDLRCGMPSICFVLDQSNHVRGNQGKMRDLIKRISMLVDESSSSVMYSAYKLTEAADVIQSKTNELSALLAAVDVTRPMLQPTTYSAGFRACFEDMKDSLDRKTIILLAGSSDKGDPPLLGSDLIQEIYDAKVNVVTLGVGPKYKKSVIRNLASDRNYFIVRDFNSLRNKGKSLFKKICLS